MKLRADRAALADAVGWVAQATPRNAGTVPILGAVRITADGGLGEGLAVLRAFDYETAHTATVEVAVLDAGQVLVSARILRDILAAGNADVVDLALDGGRLAITAGRSSYRLATLPLDEYPTLPSFPDEVGTITRANLVDLVDTVEHAASRDQSIAALCVIHLTGTKGKAGTVTAEATDRFRMARDAAPWTGRKAFDARIPVAALTGALKGITGDELRIGATENLFGITDGVRTVTTRGIADEFPVLGPFLEIDTPLVVEVDSDVLAGALRRADLVNDARSALRLRIGGAEIQVEADGQAGAGAEYVAADMPDGEVDLEVLFRGGFLADGLAAIGGRVALGFVTPTKPLLITPTDGRTARAVVMPRRSVRP